MLFQCQCYKYVNKLRSIKLKTKHSFVKLQRFVTGLFGLVLVSCVSAAVKDIWKENALSGADDNILLRKLRLSPSSSAAAASASSSYSSKSSEGYDYPKPAIPFVSI